MFLRVLPISRIAVLSLRGSIGFGLDPDGVVSMLGGLRKNRRVKAVVLNINSPGGGAGGSEALYRAVKRLVGEKPVVAYFQDTGASGAYEMGCAATRIVATESSLVGSIGVITGKLSLERFFEELGIGLKFIKSGKHKDMLRPHRDLTEDEEEIIQKMSDEMHEIFIKHVAENRNLPIDKVREIATGEVFSGLRAKQIGLVDKNGDLSDAINLASELSKVPADRTVFITPKRSLLRRLLEPLIGEFIDQLITYYLRFSRNLLR